jgi:hypothetical protein
LYLFSDACTGLIPQAYTYGVDAVCSDLLTIPIYSEKENIHEDLLRQVYLYTYFFLESEKYINLAVPD